jgi:orotidine-5'-phosphate decarboxylase
LNANCGNSGAADWLEENRGNHLSTIEGKDRLIVALDVESIDAARTMVDDLEGVVDFFKIGLVLQLAPGVESFIRALLTEGKRVFLDYKYYDIEETLKKAVARAATLGVNFLTIHGSSKLIKAAVQAKGASSLKLFTVTVLTSMDVQDIAEMGYKDVSVKDLVTFRAQTALDAGCDGVIASGLEAERIKTISQGKLLVVTPGIRGSEYPGDDQTRRVTPTQAIAAGADYLVVGRPITHDADPRKQAEAHLREMQAAFDVRYNTALA